MPNQVVVLVVEDEERVHQYLMKELLDSGFVQEVVVADRLSEAVSAFEKIKDTLGAVLMDACLMDDCPDTLELTRHIRANFGGVIVAMSRDPGYRQMQVVAGCNHQCSKYEAAGYLLKILTANQ